MAIILKPTNGAGRASPFWYAAFNYRGPDGELVRVKKSTGSKDKREAQRLANEMEAKANELAAGRLTIGRLREALQDLAERITGESLADTTTKAWFGEWLEQKKAASKPGTYERYQVTINRFLAFLGSKAGRGLHHLTAGDVRGFRQQETDSGKAASSCNMDVKIISMPLRKAQRLGIVRLNPAEAVERLEDDGETREPFTVEQVQAILGAAPDEDWRGVILFGLYTGARLGDCSRMRWASLDLHQGTVRFKPVKTSKGKKGKEVFIPLHPALLDHLMSLSAPDDGAAFVFPSLASQPISGTRGLSRRFHAIMEAAGVSAPLARSRGKAREGVKNAGREVRALTFHSLRHTLTTLMHNAGVSRELRMQVTGHATEQAHATYTHTELETLRAALASVPSI